jgi:hypothetical protein
MFHLCFLSSFLSVNTILMFHTVYVYISIDDPTLNCVLNLHAVQLCYVG